MTKDGKYIIRVVKGNNSKTYEIESKQDTNAIEASIMFFYLADKRNGLDPTIEEVVYMAYKEDDVIEDFDEIEDTMADYEVDLD